MTPFEYSQLGVKNGYISANDEVEDMRFISGMRKALPWLEFSYDFGHGREKIVH